MIVLWGSARAVELPLEQLRFDPDPLALNSLPIATVKATVGVAKGGWEPAAGGPPPAPSPVGGELPLGPLDCPLGRSPAATCPRIAGRPKLPYWLPALTVELVIFCGVAFWAAVLAALAVAFWS